MSMGTLFELVAEGDLRSLKRAIEHDPSKLNQQTSPLTLLMWSVYPRSGGHPKIAKWLVAQGAKMDLQEMGHGRTALMIACGYDQPEAAEMLIKSGANLDIQAKTGYTALMFACQNKQPRLARMIIKRGAALDLANSDGWTALMTAACHGEPDTVGLLADYGASLDLQNKTGMTALLGAIEHGKEENALLLIERGAAVDIVNRDGYSALMTACSLQLPRVASVLLDRGADPTIVAESGWTALMLAARHGMTDTVQLLIQRGAPIHVRDPEGWTPYQLARLCGSKETIEVLVKFGADLACALSPSRTALLLACRNDDHGTVRRLLAEGADPNTADEKDVSSLMDACRHGRKEIAFLLIQSGADINARALNGWTALMMACRNNQPEIARHLVDLNASLDDRSNAGWTALSLACRYHLPEIARLLIAAGANLNLRKTDGWSALMYACGYGQPETARALILNGANLDFEDTHGSTALVLARFNKLDEIADMLIKHGASDEFGSPYANNASAQEFPAGSHSPFPSDPQMHEASVVLSEEAYSKRIDGLEISKALLEACRSDEAKRAQDLIEAGADLDFQDAEGWTPLICAAVNGMDSTVRFLVDNGAALDLKTRKDQFTALMHACESGDFGIVKILVERGADFEIQNSNGGTALILACRYEFPDIANYLIEQGADVTVCDNHKQTALFFAERNSLSKTISLLQRYGAVESSHHSHPSEDLHARPRPHQATALLDACRNGRGDDARALIGSGFEIDTQDVRGWTALMLACSNGLPEIAELLIAKGADVNAQKQDGWTALMFACRHKQERVAQLLMECGADINTQNCNGWTALIVSSRYRATETAQGLILRGADLDKKDTMGRTALDFACVYADAKLVQALLAAGATADVRDERDRSLISIVKALGKRDIVRLLQNAKTGLAKMNRHTAPTECEEELLASADRDSLSYELIRACREGRMAEARAIVLEGAPLDVSDPSGWTPLMYACRCEDTRLAELLVNRGAKLDSQNSDGWSALMLACRLERRHLVDILLCYGAKVDLRANQGWTALMLSCFDLDAEVLPADQTVNVSCAQLCWTAGASLHWSSVDGQTAPTIAKSTSNRKDVEIFLDFVGESDLAAYLLDDQQLPRSTVLSFFQKNILTFQDVAKLDESALVCLGVNNNAQATKILRAAAKRSLAVSYPLDPAQQHQTMIDVHCLVAEVARAREETPEDLHGVLLHERIRQALTDLDAFADPFSSLTELVERMDNIDVQMAVFDDLQAEMARDSSRSAERDRARDALVRFISSAFEDGQGEQTLANWQTDVGIRRMLEVCESAWCEAGFGEIPSLSSDASIDFSVMKTGIEEVHDLERSFVSHANLIKSRYLQTCDALRALSKRSEELVPDRSTLFFSIEHPEVTYKLTEEIKQVENALFEELNALRADLPSMRRLVFASQNFLMSAIIYFRNTLPEELGDLVNRIKNVKALKAYLEQGSKAPDTRPIVVLRKELFDLRRSRAHAVQELEYAREAREALCAENDEEIAQLEEQVSAINLYDTCRDVCRQRADILAHAEQHYPELLHDSAWLRTLGIMDVGQVELSKLGLWWDGVTLQDFTIVSRLSSTPGKEVLHVCDPYGQDLVLREFHLIEAGRSRHFFAQMTTLAKIQSPHLVHVEAIFMKSPQTGYLVSPLYTGGNLASFIRNDTKTSVKERRFLAVGILEGLCALHDCGFVHSFLEPKRVFLTSTLEPVLQPFDGELSSERSMSNLMQTADSYLALETHEGRHKAVNTSVDVFAAGVIFKELFPNCSSAMCELIAAMCSADPESRPTAREALHHMHVQKCPEKPPGEDGLFADLHVVHEAWAKLRSKRVNAYLRYQISNEAMRAIVRSEIKPYLTHDIYESTSSPGFT
ncbi:Ankyrin repeat domain-containing protein 50 [Hondaea fermentalgiana]|uniref:Ankyrin repeat domain-containing protein 50 n=1 Tax=Hondaea fermentalgiana TaxID=2315210 RepID=A0A2R5GNN0_9STRA|nr:Ankyrin repeat domain-containing protein 50 [Hondaea fermentalgiana]|eukprot:GBG32490.1 Ankyrin repeat domain-containing protein 50 [Hondaea fermentalgiana]